jgi:hypothetical protein
MKLMNKATKGRFKTRKSKKKERDFQTYEPNSSGQYLPLHYVLAGVVKGRV